MINIIGLGYIGLPTALMFASHGVEVVGTDYNKELVATLNAGKTTFEEAGLDDLFNDAVNCGIKFSTEYQSTDMYIVAVPTPYDKESKRIDAKYVIAAVKQVMEGAPCVELAPQNTQIRKLQHDLVEQYGLQSTSIGEGENRHLRVSR